jgi:hypothetical protein
MLCGHNVQFSNVKTGGIQSNHQKRVTRYLFSANVDTVKPTENTSLLAFNFWPNRNTAFIANL